MQIRLYDTTLRDGTQREGLSLSVEDKLKIAWALDELGVHYIEGGWPGSNPKDADFFARVKRAPLPHARIAAFGSTRRAESRCEADPSVLALVAAETPVVTLVGKSSVLHVQRVLETSRDENLRMIGDTVGFFRRLDREVVFDAEHFFDGWALDPEYALATLGAAADAGAHWIVLCDTNGGTLPDAIRDVIRCVRERIVAPLGIHAHNDAGIAVANALAAVQSGCTQVQGTINGYGERCGNVDLVPVIANLQLKLGRAVLAPAQLRRLTQVSHVVAAIANLNPDAHAPYVGRSAFAHKGGIHVAAIAKLPESYQHIDPALVGNGLRVVVSEVAGRRNIRLRAEALGLDPDKRDRGPAADQGARAPRIPVRGRRWLVRDAAPSRRRPDTAPPFELLDFTVISEKRGGQRVAAQATVKLRVGDEMMHTAAEGDGPVNALDRALRKALVPHYPELDEVRLVDYKVRIVDEHLGTAAKPRCLIESARGAERWSTVGCSENIIEASWLALWDSLELPLLRSGARLPAPAPTPPE